MITALYQSFIPTIWLSLEIAQRSVGSSWKSLANVVAEQAKAEGILEWSGTH